MSTPNLLVVDDCPDFLDILRQFFTSRGIGVETAANGKKAIARYLANPGLYDAILLDVQMPVMDGLAVVRYIRENESGFEKRIPIIGMSGQAADESCFDYFLRKPFQLGSALNIVSRAIGDSGITMRA